MIMTVTLSPQIFPSKGYMENVTQITLNGDHTPPPQTKTRQNYKLECCD